MRLASPVGIALQRLDDDLVFFAVCFRRILAVLNFFTYFFEAVVRHPPTLTLTLTLTLTFTFTHTHTRVGPNLGRKESL